MKQWNTLGEKLKALRKSSKLTLKQLSEEVNLSVAFISDIERNKTSPSIKSLAVLAEYYGITASEILKDLNL